MTKKKKTKQNLQVVGPFDKEMGGGKVASRVGGVTSRPGKLRLEGARVWMASRRERWLCLDTSNSIREDLTEKKTQGMKKRYKIKREKSPLEGKEDESEWEENSMGKKRRSRRRECRLVGSRSSLAARNPSGGFSLSLSVWCEVSVQTSEASGPR